MLKAARAQGRPMIVIAMITAAIIQPSAIQTPPVRIQSTFRMTFSGDIRAPLAGLAAPAIGGPDSTWWEHGDRRDVSPTYAGFRAGGGRGARFGPTVADGDRFGAHSRAMPRRTPRAKDRSMPILIFIVLVILIAQVGFWDTFSAILGGVAMIALLVLLAIALLVFAGMMLLRRMR